MTFKPVFVLSTAFWLAACGGGGGGETINPSASNPASTVTSNPPSASQGVTSTQVTPTQGGSSQGGNITASNSCSLPNFQAEVLAAVNAARSKPRNCGTEAKAAAAQVAWSDTLFTAAAGHSQDMAQRNYFDHVTPEGITMAQRAEQAGYRYRALGENIAAGQGTVADVMQGWLESPGHCRNIMNAVYTEVAVACVATARPMYPTYWTMELGKPQ
jgi:uncharacterized protein YkwD